MFRHKRHRTEALQVISKASVCTYFLSDNIDMVRPQTSCGADSHAIAIRFRFDGTERY